MTDTDRRKHEPKRGISKEALDGLLVEGLRVRQMAQRLGVAPNTVRHWLRRHGLSTKLAAVGRQGPVGSRGLDPENLMAVCASCHGRLEAKVRRRSERAVRGVKVSYSDTPAASTVNRQTGSAPG